MHDVLASKDENIRTISQQLLDLKTEQDALKRDAQVQSEELVEKIKVLQQQLAEVRLYL